MHVALPLASARLYYDQAAQPATFSSYSSLLLPLMTGYGCQAVYMLPQSAL